MQFLVSILHVLQNAVLATVGVRTHGLTLLIQKLFQMTIFQVGSIPELCMCSLSSTLELNFSASHGILDSDMGYFTMPLVRTMCSVKLNSEGNICSVALGFSWRK